MAIHRDTPVRILLIDDDPDLVDVVRSQLEAHHEALQVEVETDAVRVLDRLDADERIECVVSDYEMPEIDGLELFASIRAERPTMPVLLYTNVDRSELLGEALASGVDDFITKDIGSDHYRLLGHRIKRAIERGRATRAADRAEAALDAVSEGVCVVDADGRISYANAAYHEHFGYDPGTLVGESWERLVPADRIDLVLSEVVPCVEEHGVWDGECEGLRENGSAIRSATRVADLPDGQLVIVTNPVEETPSRPAAAKEEPVS
jgi:PAS domain S-box-containing protein